MEIISKKDGYGHLIKWLTKLVDVLIINLVFVLFSVFLKSFFGYDFIVDSNKVGELFLLVNLSYFITASIIEVDASSNIIFFDKIIQRAFSFITLYILILIVGISLLDTISLEWTIWIGLYIVLVSAYSLWYIILRIGLKLYRRKGYNYKRIVIVGAGLDGMSVYKEILSHDYGYKVLGFFDDNKELKSIQTESFPYLGTVVDVKSYCSSNRVDEIYCTLPGNQEAKIINLLNFAEKNVIRFYLVPEFYKYIKRKLTLNFLQSIPIIAIRREPLQLIHKRLVKRMFDIVFSLAVLLTIFPILFVILGLLIKLTSSGPVFFAQERTGLKGGGFKCYKFRSMRLNKDSDSKPSSKNDPRITLIGRFMRRTSLDEMPQFFNVLIGDMSIVGPRPHMIQQTTLYEQLIDRFMIRHLIKPGITGWAQISGFRGETRTIQQMEGRFRRDVWYIENWSFFLDIKIIFVTILNLFRGEDNAC